MIKGIRKNVYVMKCGKDSPFESAMFILKEGVRENSFNDNILAEAEKLVESAFSDHRNEKLGKFPKRKKTK